MVVSCGLSQFQSDLLDMGKWDPENDGYHWLLMTIDCLFRMGWAILVNRKDAKEMAFQKLFEENHPPPFPAYKLLTDEGTKFTNKAMQTFLEKKP